MTYIADTANILDGLGRGTARGRMPGRTGSRLSHLSEWYIRDEDDVDEDDRDDGNDGDDGQTGSGINGVGAAGGASAAPGLSRTPTRRVAPYSDLAATYDRALGIRSFVRTKRAFELVVRRYGVCFGAAADVGCGTGLFACYLARCWGARVFAVDRSPHMLRVGACRCRDPRVQFLRQDLRGLQLPQAVDLVTANFDTVNHLLTASDLALAFQRIAANLRPGGHFVFDVITRAQAAMRPVVQVHRLPARGRALFQRIGWDPRRGLLSIVILHRWPRPSPPSVELHVERAYSPAQVGRLLLDSGFVIRGVHDAVSLRVPEGCPPRLLVVARKPGRPDR